MLDIELFSIVRSELINQFSLYNKHDLTDVKVTRANQPTQQAAGNGRTVFITRVGNPQVGGGFKYNGTTRTEQKFKRATFQFDVLAEFDPADLNALLPGDIINITADLIQSYNAIRNLRANGVNIERVTDVRPSYFVNDKDRFESSPSFDLTANYQHDYENEISSVTRVTTNNYGV